MFSGFFSHSPIQKRPDDKCHLLELADEMLLLIFSWLPKKDYAMLSLVSRYFHVLVNDATLWKPDACEFLRPKQAKWCEKHNLSYKQVIMTRIQKTQAALKKQEQCISEIYYAPKNDFRKIAFKNIYQAIMDDDIALVLRLMNSRLTRLLPEQMDTKRKRIPAFAEVLRNDDEHFSANKKVICRMDLLAIPTLLPILCSAYAVKGYRTCLDIYFYFLSERQLYQEENFHDVTNSQFPLKMLDKLEVIKIAFPKHEVRPVRVAFMKALLLSILRFVPNDHACIKQWVKCCEYEDGLKAMQFAFDSYKKNAHVQCYMLSTLLQVEDEHINNILIKLKLAEEITQEFPVFFALEKETSSMQRICGKLQMLIATVEIHKKRLNGVRHVKKESVDFICEFLTRHLLSMLTSLQPDGEWSVAENIKSAEEISENQDGQSYCEYLNKVAQELQKVLTQLQFHLPTDDAREKDAVDPEALRALFVMNLTGLLNTTCSYRSEKHAANDKQKKSACRIA